MPITPDTKDWTWVLGERCPECAFDSRAVEFSALPGLIRASTEPWPDVLSRDDVRDRPDDHTWSALEYACHVRDVYRIFVIRLHLMLEQDNPAFENWDQDATAIRDRYSEQDPSVVAEELAAAAGAVADSFAAVHPDQTSRTGLRSDGSTFTVETLGRYMIHDPIHHLHDVGVDVTGLTTPT